MDAILFIVASIFLILYSNSNPDKPLIKGDEPVREKEVDMSKRVTKLNDNYYEDQAAFMEVANGLGYPKTR